MVKIPLNYKNLHKICHIVKIVRAIYLKLKIHILLRIVLALALNRCFLEIGVNLKSLIILHQAQLSDMKQSLSVIGTICKMVINTCLTITKIA